MEKHCPLRDMPYSSKASHAMKPSTAVLSGVNWYLFTHDDFYIPQALELKKQDDNAQVVAFYHCFHFHSIDSAYIKKDCVGLLDKKSSLLNYY